MLVAGPLKRMLSPLVNPQVFDFWASHLSPTLSWERPLAKVLARRVEARDTVTLVLRPNRHVGGFAPGQHVSVTVSVNGVRLTRSYSPSWLGRRRMAITVKKMPGGKVSEWLTECCDEGDVLEIGPAFGDMTQPSLERPWLLVAAGSGITPMMSLLRAAATLERPLPPITLLYWARTRADLCFGRELDQLAARLPSLTVQRLLTRESVLLPEERSGRPDETLLRALVPDLAAQQAYVCGPAGFVATVRTLLEGAVATCQAEAFSLPDVSVVEGQPVQVTLARSGRVLSVPAGAPLLAALEARGERPAHGCRMGICNTCVCGKLAGTTGDLLGGGLSQEPMGAMKLCVSTARTDTTLDL